MDEGRQALAAVLDSAQREAVVIQRQKLNAALIFSLQEYERLTALNVDEFHVSATASASRPTRAAPTEGKLTERVSNANG
jgi:hypothetical protein